MKQKQSKILIHRQNNTFSNRNDSIRLSSYNSERPGTQNSIRTEINSLKQGQEKIISELSKMTISIDNLARQIGKLAQKNNNGNNSKKSSLNQSLNSDFSKNSSGTAIYVRRNEAKNNNTKEDNTEQIPNPKVSQITNFKYYSKVSRKTK